MDELPMIYGSLMLHHAITREPYKTRILPWLFLIGVAISVLMVVLKESPLPLQLSFGVLIASLVLRCMRMAWLDGRLWESSLLSAGSVMYLAAFACWLRKSSALCEALTSIFVFAVLTLCGEKAWRCRAWGVGDTGQIAFRHLRMHPPECYFEPHCLGAIDFCNFY